MLRRNFVVFDTETTGLSHNHQDIIQIAGYVVMDGLKEEPFNFRCKPFNWGSISQEALDVNGVTIEMLQNADDPRDVMKRFRETITKVRNASGDERVQLVAHNLPFDYRFLEAQFIKCCFSDFEEWFLPKEMGVCTQKYSKVASKRLGWPVENHRLITLAAYHGISFDAHDALGDAYACHCLLNILVGAGIVEQEPASICGDINLNF